MRLPFYPLYRFEITGLIVLHVLLCFIRFTVLRSPFDYFTVSTTCKWSCASQFAVLTLHESIGRFGKEIKKRKENMTNERNNKEDEEK